jgi:hypothetical protein
MRFRRAPGLHDAHTRVRGFRRVRVLNAITAVALLLSGCAAGGAGFCAAAGGTYQGGTCVERNGHEAADAACERRGGMYLPGQDYCAFRGGGQ